MPQIVQVNVSQTGAPAPVTLQRTGALISQGATTLAAGKTALMTQQPDLTAQLAAPLAISSISYSSGVATVTTGVAIPGLSTGDEFPTTIAGVTPAGYNGFFEATVTGPSTFTYPLASNPGSVTVEGTYTPPDQGELISMLTGCFAQSRSPAVNVLELGPGDGATGPNALDTWIQNNPNTIYSFLVPRDWDGETTFLALLQKYRTPGALIKFFFTTTVETYTQYVGIPFGEACAGVEAPGLPLTEFSMAAVFQRSLQYNPSSSNRFTPFNYSFLFGVTPYPAGGGNNTLLTQLKAANINYVGTGAEGGLSDTILVGGKMLDGRPFGYWYATNFMQLRLDRDVTAAIIDGSNDPENPLDYDQNGIDRLQDVQVGDLQDGISFGLLTGNVGRSDLDGDDFEDALDADDFVNTNVVNAVPFIQYTEENPDDRPQGIYSGYSIVIIPEIGFDSVQINMNVTDFITQ